MNNPLLPLFLFLVVPCYSSLGGFNGEEDLELLRVVAADGREWGVKFSGVVMEEGEGLAVADRKSNEVHNEASELWTYES